jgi:hypothetical protein
MSFCGVLPAQKHTIFLAFSQSGIVEWHCSTKTKNIEQRRLSDTVKFANPSLKGGDPLKNKQESHPI